MTSRKPKTVALVSLGCPKNLVDSEIMLGMIKGAGLELTSVEEDADAIVVNTCGFLGDAAEESVNEILRLAAHKSGRCRVLVVAGCLTQRYKEKLAVELPEVDYFVGTGEYPRIADIILHGSDKRVMADASTYIHDYSTPRVLSTPRHYAYIKIAEGCSNLCSYCTIPSIRGKFRSRTIDSIVREAADLAAAGVKEINLVAQDITSFGRDKRGSGEKLPSLVRALTKVEGIDWIRLLYLYPTRVTNELIAVIRDEPKVCKYVDIPVQHVSTRVLKAMNRTGGKADIKRVIARLRKEIPGLTLRTSIIAGFPGETEKEFNELLTFIKEAAFERLGVFKYSTEEGTPAAAMKGQVAERVKAARLRKLMTEQRRISLKKNRALIGTEVDVLMEGTEDGGGGAMLLKGRASSQAPDVDGVAYISTDTGVEAGRIVRCRITDAGPYDFVVEQA